MQQRTVHIFRAMYRKAGDIGRNTAMTHPAMTPACTYGYIAEQLQPKLFPINFAGSGIILGYYFKAKFGFSIL